jgi:hypothetical protein
MFLLSGIRKLGFVELGGGPAPERIDGPRERATRACDPRAHGADGHPESGGCLLVGEFSPYDQQQRVTILAREPPQLADELCAQGTILVLDQLRRSGRETLQRPQASLLLSTMIGDDVVGDAEQPRQSALLLSAAPLSPSEGAGEHLSGEVSARLRADAPSDIPANRDVVPLIQNGERRRLGGRTRKHLWVR